MTGPEGDLWSLADAPGGTGREGSTGCGPRFG
jgi:hypothetical protein